MNFLVDDFKFKAYLEFIEKAEWSANSETLNKGISKMARSATYTKKINVVEALKSLDSVSYYHVRQLCRDGYVTVEKDAEAKKEGRGRMPLKYSVSKKGANLVRLSANWAKPVSA